MSPDKERELKKLIKKNGGISYDLLHLRPDELLSVLRKEKLARRARRKL